MKLFYILSSFAQCLLVSAFNPICNLNLSRESCSQLSYCSWCVSAIVFQPSLCIPKADAIWIPAFVYKCENLTNEVIL